MTASVLVHRKNARNLFELKKDAVHAKGRAVALLDDPLAELIVVRDHGVEIARWVRASPIRWVYSDPWGRV